MFQGIRVPQNTETIHWRKRTFAGWGIVIVASNAIDRRTFHRVWCCGSSVSHLANLVLSIKKLRLSPHFESDCCENRIQSTTLLTFLKCLPPKLESLKVPPVLLPSDQDAATAILSTSDFLDCYCHFPHSLTRLSFSHATVAYRRAGTPSWLSDDYFAHLPPSLTELVLGDVGGITHRFWDVIPPNIAKIQIHISSGLQTSKFDRKSGKYKVKFRKM